MKVVSFDEKSTFILSFYFFGFGKFFVFWHLGYVILQTLRSLSEKILPGLHFS
ncbi:unnamed protein product, partial [Amoebophrya sp. A120]|eukprot:GSA120T00012540001.1